MALETVQNMLHGPANQAAATGCCAEETSLLQPGALTLLVPVKSFPPDEQQAVLKQEGDLQALPQHSKLHQVNRTLCFCCLLLLQVRACRLLLSLLLLVALIINPCVPIVAAAKSCRMLLYAYAPWLPRHTKVLF